MIVSIIHYKGGVGKTTTACNLAGVAYKRGLRALLFDLDPQGSLSTTFGVRSGPTGYDWLRGDAPLSDVIVRVRPLSRGPNRRSTDSGLAERRAGETESAVGAGRAESSPESRAQGPPCIDVVRSSERLSSLQGALRGKKMLDFVERVFDREDVQPILDSYDYVVIDCPPGADYLAENALRTSDVVLSTMELAYMSTSGLLRVAANIRLAREEGYEPRWLVVPTRYRRRRVQTRQVYQNLVDQLGAYPEGIVLEPIVESVDLAYAYDARQTVFEYAPAGRGAACYARVFDQLEAVRADVESQIVVAP